MVIEFQSHLGSISTREGSDNDNEQNRFNPTLVRLAPSEDITMPYYQLRFNPTLVRLALWCGMKTSPDVEVSIPPWFD